MRGFGSVYRRRKNGEILPTWWIKYYHRGKVVRESSGSRERKDAERFLRKRLSEVEGERWGRGAFVGPASERLSIGDLLVSYLRRYCEKRNLDPDSPPSKVVSLLKPIRETFGAMRAVTVDEDAISLAIRRWKDDGLQPSTINRRLEIMRTSFRLAIKRRRISYMPEIQRLEEHNIRRDFVEPEVFEAILAHLPAWVRDFARFGYITGWRRGEITALRWSDVDRAAGEIRLRAENSKNREGSVVPLVGELATLIDRRWSGRAVETKQGTRITPWVFHRNGFPLWEKYFRKVWNIATAEAGVPGLRFHDFRRSAVRNLIRAGVPDRVAMEITHHKTRSVFDRYNIVSTGDMNTALAKVQAHIASHTSRNSAPLA